MRSRRVLSRVEDEECRQCGPLLPGRTRHSHNGTCGMGARAGSRLAVSRGPKDCCVPARRAESAELTMQMAAREKTGVASRITERPTRQDG
jgi:hypothetical protein